jgi:hypothetical protein
MQEAGSVGFIWDIYGVVVDSPHEEAWRITAMKEPWNIEDMSSDFYFTYVASRTRYDGGNNILELKGVYECLGATTEDERSALLERFCTEKNVLLRELIKAGRFSLFADAIQLLLKAKSIGIRQAAASASKNAKDMLTLISKPRIMEEVGNDFGVLREGGSLYSIFDVDACGIDVGGKKDILRFAAQSLNARSLAGMKRFVVFEDAPSGIEAAKSVGYYAVGVLRIGQEDALRKVGADIIAPDLKLVEIADLL